MKKIINAAKRVIQKTRKAFSTKRPSKISYAIRKSAAGEKIAHQAAEGRIGIRHNFTNYESSLRLRFAATRMRGRTGNKHKAKRYARNSLTMEGRAIVIDGQKMARYVKPARVVLFDEAHHGR